MTNFRISRICRLCIILLSFFACSCNGDRLSEIESDIENLTTRVDDIEKSLAELRQAYHDGKIISSVDPYSENGLTGWNITFSDNSVINILNGEKGDKGDQGEKGDKGDQGDQGVQGEKGEDAVTPICDIDDEGYWAVSYDNGKSFTRLLDKNGSAIPARGDKGDKGDQGDKGDKGDKGDYGDKGNEGDQGDKGDKGDKGDQGDKGNDGLSVRIVVENGYYVIQSYYASDAGVVIESIPTSYRADKSTSIASIVKNSETGIITMTMADGTIYEFNLEVVYPTGIVLLESRLLLCPNMEASFEFRVNPSNAKLDLDLASGQIALDLVNENLSRASSYITSPVNYELVRVESSKADDGQVKEGQYTAYIRDLGLATDYSDGVVLVISTKDGNGNDIQISSSMLNVYWEQPSGEMCSFSIGRYDAEFNGSNIVVSLPHASDVSSLRADFEVSGAKVYVGGVEQFSGRTANNFSSPVEYTVVSATGETKTYTVMISYSELPIVYINTAGGAPVVSKEEWISGSRMVISNTPDGIYDMDCGVSIRGRGNSTWYSPKKPYAIKLDEKAEVLGMPKHKRWVLLANWIDRTCMRNAVAFEISRATEHLEWTPRGRFVELVLNGEFMGNYYLCEQIKVDENRVDIAEMRSTDIGAYSITGGYLLELDTYYDEANKFRSNHGTYGGEAGLPVNIKDPDEDVIVPEQFEYIKDYFLKAESLIYADDFPENKSYKAYIDYDTFIDWWFVYELAKSNEPNHPKSSYMYKDRNGKLKMGPVWDFDYGTFSSGTTKFCIADAIWYGRLFKDPDFVARVKEKWAASKPAFEAVCAYIDEQAKEIRVSVEADKKQWPISEVVNRDETLSFDDAVARLKRIYSARITEMDNNIAKL